MKTKLLLLILFTFTIGNLTIAQCSRSGSFIAADPTQYAISGGANITFMTNGSKVVNFESNFSTVQGLNLQVFLSPTPSYNPSTALQISTQPLQDDNGGMDTGDVISGVKSFTVPASVELGDYDNVLIVCTVINALWGHVALGQNTGADCATLSTSSLDLSTVKLFPNPATDLVHVSNNISEEVSLEIFNVLGKSVFISSKNTFNQINIDLSNFDSGIYIVRISSNENSVTQRLIVK